MGKRKIGEIYNKPIVEGDINLKTPNEIHKSELSGGGSGGGEGKEWYYCFRCWEFVKDTNLNDSEALETIDMIELLTSPIARIVEYTSTKPSEPDVYYETTTTTPRQIDLETVIYFKYNENYYYHLPVNNKLLVFKGTLEERLEDFNKFISLNGGEVIDFSKYFDKRTKEEYDSIITKEELTVDDLLNNIQ